MYNTRIYVKVANENLEQKLEKVMKANEKWKEKTGKLVRRQVREVSVGRQLVSRDIGARVMKRTCNRGL